jgi:NADPH-dependent curcumin reductase CurA
LALATLGLWRSSWIAWLFLVIVVGAGGAFPIPALTAAQVLDEALGIEGGGWVVVNGAGGVTGGLLVQLAAARGARVIATASAKKAERIRDYGASEVLDYHGDWPALVRETPAAARPRPSTCPRAGGHVERGC